MTYNGFKNYETWNVVLWINNDEGLYNLARQCASYDEFVDCMKDLGGSIGYETPDGTSWSDSAINQFEMQEFWQESFSKLFT